MRVYSLTDKYMPKIRYLVVFSVLLILVLLSSLIPLATVQLVLADPGRLVWTSVDTPSPLSNIIVSPSEINVMALGSDDRTFYAVDIPNNSVHKSTDGGVSWMVELGANIAAAGAFMPVWNLAVAPDDVNFVVAVTDETGGPGGPRRVFISENGGASWENTNFPILPGEYISCVDVSVTYENNKRDVAIGTRTGAGTGRVYVLQSPGFSAWADQSLPASDVVALKFSPAYPSDYSLVVISSSAADTRLHLGIRDTAANAIAWNSDSGYPVLLWDPVFAPPNFSPTCSQIITADLELPSDFSGQNIALRRYYVSTDVTTAGVQFGVYRVDDTVPHRIIPPTTGRISSIAYWGTYDEGVLLAGEVTANPTLGLVNVWRASDCTAGTPAWQKSDTLKSPTGGGNSGYANAQVAWNTEGARAYCGTSSACLGMFDIPDGSINCAAQTEWPDGYLNGVALDESAFSVSPYSPAYAQLLVSFGKTQDSAIGYIWNQLSLIDTQIDFLSDVAALEVPETGQALANYNVLYLVSINTAAVPVSFDSVWRSTTDPPGRSWERVLCTATADNGTILRVKQTSYEETDRSAVIVFADLLTDVVGYSGDEGQLWDVRIFTIVTDLALSSDDVIYILNDTIVYRYQREGTGWVLKHKLDTELDAGHTIAVPLKNPKNEIDVTADWVIVGEAGPPNGSGRIVYADFSEGVVSDEPPISERVAPPVEGDAHVIADDKFEQNLTIYNATHDPADGSGKIYRWVIGESTAWDELEPPNTAFYGLAQRNDVLYGAWRKADVPEIITHNSGVDRTLFPRANVPPPPEWDYLVVELPDNVIFTHEPSSLKISSNEYNNLWAIDNRAYDFTNKVGCLWAYTDTIAKVGPWTTSPPSGSSIPIDPKSGRATEVNFSWRQLSYSSAYELQVAKDIDFTIRVLVNENITPVDQLAPECYLPAGSLIPVSGSNIASWGNLESGHTYYWRVRARAAITGEIVRSPWSATMYFTVESGLPVAAPYPTVTLFSPTYGARGVSRSPGFSWSPMPKTAKYEFVLAKDAALQQVVVKAEAPVTSYMYDGKLDFNTTYFWQVRAVEPVVSDPSAIGTFTVVAEEKLAITEPEEPSPIPSWVWWVIAIWGALLAAMIAFATVKPRYIRPKASAVIKFESIKLEPLIDRPPNPITRIWNSIKMRIRRRRYLSRSGGDEPGDSQE